MHLPPLFWEAFFLTSPIINTIRRVYPDAIIDLLVYKGTGVLLENHSGIHNILEADHSSKLNFTQRLFSELKLLKRLRNTNYDFGLFLTTQWRIAFMGRALRSARTAAVDDQKRRNSLWINSFSSIFPEAGENHVIERNLRALESLGIKTEGKDKDTLKNEVYDILTDSKKSDKEDDFNVNSMARTIGGMVGEYQKMRSEVEEIVFSELNEMKEPIQSMKDEADDIKQSLTIKIIHFIEYIKAKFV